MGRLSNEGPIGMINLTAVALEDDSEPAVGECLAQQECIGEGRDILDGVDEVGEWLPIYKAF